MWTAQTVAAGSCPCFNTSDILAAQSYGSVNGYVATYTDANQLVWLSWEKQGSLPVNAAMWIDASVATCEAKTNVTPFGAAELFETTFFPGLTRNWSAGVDHGVQHGALSAQEIAVCEGLLRAVRAGVPAVQINYTATGLPSGEQVVIQPPVGGALVVGDNGTVAFADGLLGFGSSYTSSVLAQPTSATCALSGNASGTVGTSNIDVAVTCIAATTQPASCPCYAYSDVTDALSLPGAVSLSSSTQFAAAGLTSFSGAYAPATASHGETGAGHGTFSNGDAFCLLGCDELSGVSGSCGAFPTPTQAIAPLTTAQVAACEAALSPPAGCTVTFAGGTGELPASLSLPAECFLLEDPSSLDVGGVAFLVGSALPTIGDSPELMAFWDTFVANNGGGASGLEFGMFTFSAAALTSQSVLPLLGDVGDSSLLAGELIGGTWFVDEQASNFSVSAFDATAHTFDASFTVELDSGSDSWPPDADGATSTDIERLDGSGSAATISVGGQWSAWP